MNAPPLTLCTHHLIVGDGVIGQATAQALRALSQPVTLASRHAPTRATAHVPHLVLDALDGAAMRAAATGVSHLYLTLGLPYRAAVWQRDWPRVMRNAIDAALAHGARLLWFDNVYAYGPLPLRVPMREDHPIDPPSCKGKVRAGLLTMLQQAGEREGLRWLVARSADFYGPDVRLSALYSAAIQRQLRCRVACWLGDPDTLHSFTYTPDAGRALARLALDDAAYQQSWHLPTAAPAPTPRELLTASARLLGAPTDVHALPLPLIHVLGLAVPLLREVSEMLYQNRQSYVFSSEKFMRRYPDFDVTPYAEGLRAMVESFRARA
ncbi:NAD-dependent epimerase/dehydratase family protein [Ottowia sp.]|uniref:NAD-dependent epimerase/dehydratase family protein n=1 Tax=Ottowia sp. TaxID=1898956 RepID=UPI002C38F767|nr:NAD-dependent epimerase/dehydratase family protein [Ottowia sp.]HOB67575.1 NAD-dependent epimerase/dehydratase family protein [Ottowia sp.]HPZ56996.1 NAD-dependent epimerase/dehydratase family protein [Ottowia sp.]HQD49160.1 NAD-dependent epimerase/dehydratase family protein [Ottowia sp.]